MVVIFTTVINRRYECLPLSKNGCMNVATCTCNFLVGGSVLTHPGQSIRRNCVCLRVIYFLRYFSNCSVERLRVCKESRNMPSRLEEAIKQMLPLQRKPLQRTRRHCESDRRQHYPLEDPPRTFLRSKSTRRTAVRVSRAVDELRNFHGKITVHLRPDRVIKHFMANYKTNSPFYLHL